jgi:hypothetical protein
MIGRRLALAFAGVVSLAAALWLSLLALIETSAFQSPNAAPGLDGDPCCAHPDTWGDVVIGGAAFVAIGLVALAAYAGASVLLGTALLGRVPRRPSRRG